MAPLERIPVPAHLRWREFKIRILPLLVFSVVAFLAVFIWRNRLGPQGIVGQVELHMSAIGAPVPVTVVEVLVQPHQAVKAGDPVAIVTATDPKLLEATVAAVRAEADALRKSLDAIRPQQQMMLDFERLRLNSLDFQAQLAVARVEAALAETELSRAEALAKSQILSSEEVDRLRSVRDARKVEIEELTTVVAASKVAVDQARPVRDSITDASLANATSGMLDLYETKVKMIETELGRIVLTSPRDGRVGLVQFRPGSTVPVGMPILTVASARAEHVIAFVRQPFRHKVEAGMSVELRARSGNRAFARSMIESVASHLEPVNATLYPMGTVDPRYPELGLSIRIPVPEDFEALPGETVEVVFLGPE